MKIQSVRTLTLWIGHPLALGMSWNENESMLWALLHGLYSWFYIVYNLFFL